MIPLLSYLNGLAAMMYSLLAIWFGPPLIMAIIGLVKFKKNRKLAMRLFLAAVIYVLIGGGLCASLVYT